jgi:DNA-binding transcriptional LysR family regulator
MDLSWDDARIFLAVAEEGSFSGAAETLHVGQPTVSRRIGLFEDSLGYPLFHRGRRGTELTTNGARLLPAAQQMARWAAEMEALVAGTEAEATGRVTIAGPPGVAWELLIPFARAQRESLPAIRFEILAAVEYLDLTRGEADLAIRSKPSDDPALMTLAEAVVPARPFASPEYVAKVEAGAGPGDVDWITWGRPYAHLAPRPNLEALIPDFDPVFTSDRYLLQLKACEMGMGVMYLPDTNHPYLSDRRLVALDLGLPEVNGRMYLVCARSMRWVPRVRAAIDALLDEFEQLR